MLKKIFIALAALVLVGIAAAQRALGGLLGFELFDERPANPVGRGQQLRLHILGDQLVGDARRVLEPDRAAGRITHPGFTVTLQPSPWSLVPSSGPVTGTDTVAPPTARNTPPSASGRPSTNTSSRYADG